MDDGEREATNIFCYVVAISETQKLFIYPVLKSIEMREYYDYKQPLHLLDADNLSLLEIRIAVMCRLQVVKRCLRHLCHPKPKL